MSAGLQVTIHHRFESGFALDTDFESAARRLAITGPSGSGKTSVLLAIAGLLTPQRGRIVLGERVLFDRAAGIDLPPRQRRIGLVVQEGLLFPLLSVRENLLFGRPDTGARLSLDHIAEVLEIAHLLERRPRNLSGGERQRVALGRAVLSEPELLLADEPFAALDAPRRDRLLAALAHVREELGVPLVLVSHDAGEVAALAEQVVRLGNGS